MASKSTGAKSAAETTKKKPAVTKAAATGRKPVAKKVAAKKPSAAKLVKKVATKKPAATKSKAPGKAKRTAATVTARAPKTAAKSAARNAKTGSPKARAAQSRPATRTRRAKSAVLEVSPAVIDTASAAEVAARLVLDAHSPVTAAPSPVPNFGGNVFDPPPVVAVKRGSSALRHVKEMLNKPVARQLESVFGPAPVPAESMRRFLRNQKAASNRGVRGSSHTHLGQPTVPHRSVGNGGSRAGARGGE